MLEARFNVSDYSCQAAALTLLRCECVTRLRRCFDCRVIQQCGLNLLRLISAVLFAHVPVVTQQLYMHTNAAWSGAETSTL